MALMEGVVKVLPVNSIVVVEALAYQRYTCVPAAPFATKFIEPVPHSLTAGTTGAVGGVQFKMVKVAESLMLQ